MRCCVTLFTIVIFVDDAPSSLLWPSDVFCDLIRKPHGLLFTHEADARFAAAYTSSRHEMDARPMSIEAAEAAGVFRNGDDHRQTAK